MGSQAGLSRTHCGAVVPGWRGRGLPLHGCHRAGSALAADSPGLSPWGGGHEDAGDHGLRPGHYDAVRPGKGKSNVRGVEGAERCFAQGVGRVPGKLPEATGSQVQRVAGETWGTQQAGRPTEPGDDVVRQVGRREHRPHGSAAGCGVAVGGGGWRGPRG